MKENGIPPDAPQRGASAQNTADQAGGARPTAHIRNGHDALSGGRGDSDAQPFNVRRDVYGALDLGTNNCRLLLARPSRRGFRVVDAFSRIIRLGEGLGQTGRLSEAAMVRTIDALKVCSAKLERHGVARSRFVATEACRVASNGEAFLQRVREACNLDIEILGPEAEARLAVSGCSMLIDPACDFVMVFDIGGGSSEIIWLDLT